MEQPVYMTDKWAENIGHGFKKLKCGVGAWRQRRAKESLESELANIIDTANGHRAKGVSRGADVFLTLESKANDKIAGFANKWGVSESDVRAQAPALNDLHQLTVPDSSTPAGVKLIAGIIAGIGLLMIIGFSSGVIQAAHDWALRLLTHHP